MSHATVMISNAVVDEGAIAFAHAQVLRRGRVDCLFVSVDASQVVGTGCRVETRSSSGAC
jgi:hypothetical protein